MFSYDEFPYQSATTRATNPDHFATVGHLFGVDAAPVAAARVLELGCGTGANLIAFAARNPGSRCVGIDLSAPAIEEGRACIGAIGLDNVSLTNRSFAEPGAVDGTFDFIIADGVYTWVPPDSRDRLLAICRDHLAADGIAMFGYHTLPGWHFSGAVRDMLRLLTRDAGDRRQRIGDAREAMDFLDRRNGRGDDFYGALLRSAADTIGGKSDTDFFHEYLGEDNHPVYFRDFMAAASEYGLDYVWDADPDTGFIDNFAPEVADALTRRATGLIELEQWIDMLQNRRWRNSLLCRAGTSLDRTFDAARIAPYYLSGRLEPVAGAAAVDGTMTFRDPRGTAITVDNPHTKAAVAELGRRWPEAVGFGELCEAAAAAVGAARGAADAGGADDWRGVLANELLRTYFLGSITFTREPVAVATTASARPVAAPHARWQAARRDYATNQHHVSVRPGGLECAVLPLLDGTRGRDDLATRLAETQGATGPVDRERLEKALEKLAALAFLIA